MAQIFISYSRQNGAAIDRLISELHAAGHTTWFDKRTIAIGDDWQRSIERGVADCDLVLLALSQAAIKSEWVGRELEFAYRQHKPILPAIIEAVPESDWPQPIKDTKANAVPLYPDFAAAARKIILDLRGVSSHGQRIPFIIDHTRLVQFVGRDDKLRQMHDRLNQPGRPVGLFGMGGCGKTQLAVEYAHRYRYFYPDGVFLVDAASEWGAGFARLAVRLNLKLSEAQELDHVTRAVAAMADYLEEHRESLVIFDNVEQPEEVVRRHIGLGLTPVGLPCRVLFTTRRRFDENGLRPFEIGVVSPETARAIVARSRPDLAQSPDIDPLCLALGYLPLALDLAAAFLRKKPKAKPADYLSTLQKLGLDATSKLAQLKLRDLEAYNAASLTPALEAQWSLLEQTQSAALLQIVAGHSENARVPIARLAIMSGLQDEADGISTPLADGIQDVRDASFLEVLDDDSVRMHPLVRDFVNRFRTDDLIAAHEEPVARLVNFYEDATKLEEQCAARNIDALQADLSAALNVLSGAGSDNLRSRAQSLFKLVQKEAHTFRDWNWPRFPAFFAQQIYDRAVVNGPQALADTAEARLSALGSPYLKSSLRARVESPELERTMKHRHSVLQVMITPDGKRAVSRVVGDALLVWDLELGRLLFKIPGTEHGVGPLGFVGRQSRQLVVIESGDAWDIETGEAVPPLSQREEDDVIRQLSAPDGSFAIDPYGRIVPPDGALAISPDGRKAVCPGSDFTLLVLDRQRKCESQILIGHTAQVKVVRIADDNRTAVSGGSDSTVIVWDLDTGQSRILFGHSSMISDLALTPDGRWAVSASWDRTVKLWNLKSPATATFNEGHTACILVMAVSGNGKIALTGCEMGRLVVWRPDETPASRRLASPEAYPFLITVAISVDSSRAISIWSDQTMKVWDLKTLQEEKSLTVPGEPQAAALTADGQRVVLAYWGGRTAVCDLETGLAEFIHEPSDSGFASGRLSPSVVTPDGRAVVWGPNGEETYDLTVFDLETGDRRLVRSERAGPIQRIAVTPDCKYALCDLEVFDLREGRSKVRLSIDDPQLTWCVALSPSADLAAACFADASLRIWETRTGSEICRMILTSEAHCLAFVQDGRMLFTGDGAGGVHSFAVLGYDP